MRRLQAALFAIMFTLMAPEVASSADLVTPVIRTLAKTVLPISQSHDDFETEDLGCQGFLTRFRFDEERDGVLGEFGGEEIRIKDGPTLKGVRIESLLSLNLDASKSSWSRMRVSGQLSGLKIYVEELNAEGRIIPELELSWDEPIDVSADVNTMEAIGAGVNRSSLSFHDFQIDDLESVKARMGVRYRGMPTGLLSNPLQLFIARVIKGRIRDALFDSLEEGVIGQSFTVP